MRRLSSHFVLRLLVSLLSLLSHVNLSVTYSLRNCSIDSPEDPSADLSLDCGNRELVTVPKDIPRNAVSVTLLNNWLQKINRNDFTQMSKLRILCLAFNRIAHVDDGAFIDLVALKTLSLSGNQLSSLSSNVFQGLSNLTLLDLSKNQIEFIHSSALCYLTSLQTMRLESNQLRQVVDIQPVLQLPQIQNLSLRSNQFSSFQTKDLQLNEPSGLKLLDISVNKLETFSISTPIFPLLQTIDLSDCGQDSGMKWDIPDKTLLRNITHLYFTFPLIFFEDIQEVLQSLDSLTYLQLNYMEKWLKRGLLATVCKIPTLRVLDLFYNHLQNVTMDLATCSQLTELDLSTTYISELPKGSIRSMEQLRALKVSDNSLTKVPDDIKSLSSLEILYMGSNLISEFGCDDFKNTTHLTELDLCDNHIAKLDRCVFESLPDLKWLDLSYNQLWTFGDTFKKGLQKLEYLDLSKNVLSILEKGDFQSLESLKYLNVMTDHIGRVKRKTFDKLDNLETLVVSIPCDYENSFSGLQRLENLTLYLSISYELKCPHPSDYEAFFHLKSVKTFTVICSDDHYGFPLDVPMKILEAMRHLESFTAVNIYISAPQPDTFKFNPRLKSLTFGKTDLSDLDPELFQRIPNLQNLDLSESNLKSVDFLVQANLSALRSLKLSGNEINVINETVFQFLPALRHLDLDKNPFTCECSNAGFIQWVKSNSQTQVVNAHQYTCAFPVAVKGSMLLDFDIQSCWMDTGLIYFVSSSSLVLLTLLSSFIYHFLRWQLTYAFHLFLAFLYDSRKRKKGVPHRYDAFISYNVHDEDWVYQEMLPVLEGEQGWRLCLHHRDFQPGRLSVFMSFF